MQHRLWFAAIALAAAALDLWTKATAFFHLPTIGDEVEVIPGFFYFGHTTNQGIVFGLFPGAGAVFKIVSVLAVPAILFIFLSVKKPRWVLTVALALILGGTLGNMYDRLKFDHVRDFIKFYYGGDRPWPLFNLADSCICIGVLLLSLEMLFFDEKKKGKSEDPAFSTERIAVGDTEPMPRAEDIRSVDPGDYNVRPGRENPDLTFEGPEAPDSGQPPESPDAPPKNPPTPA